MTVLRMTSPVSPAPSTSPSSPSVAEAPHHQESPRLSFSVAALLADTTTTTTSSNNKHHQSSKKSSNEQSMTMRSSPPNIFMFHNKHHHLLQVPQFPTSNLMISHHHHNHQRFVASSRVADHQKKSNDTKDYPAADATRAMDYRIPLMRASADLMDHQQVLKSERQQHSPDNNGPMKSPSAAAMRDFDGSPRSSQEEVRSRSSDEDEDNDDDDLVDVEYLQQDASSTSPIPVRPTPGYLGGFPGLPGMPGTMPSGLHHVVWATGHHQPGVAAASTAAGGFFPAHFAHHAPLNGNYYFWLINN